MEEQLRNFIENLVNIVSPADVDFSSPIGVFIYVLKIVILLVAIGLLIYSLINLGKFRNFLRSTYSELKKVEWLSRATTIRYSIIVITSLFLFTLILIGFDKSLLFIRNLLI